MTNRQLIILLVDDNHQFLERMGDLLKELPAVSEVRTAASYEEATKIKDDQELNIVLLDIHLPGKSGIDLLKYFKRLERPCLVMIVSNQADEYYKKHCLSLGADYFFDKTIEFLLIPETIQEMKNQ